MFNFRQIIENSLSYFKNMSPRDLELRGNDLDWHAYLVRYTNAVTSFTKLQRIYLEKLCSLADKIAVEAKLDLYDIPWNLVKIIADYTIEGGNPHTLGTAIIISDLFFKENIYMQLNVLIHEKIHVWQRLNRAKFDSYVIDLGYRKSNKISKLHVNNPDAIGNWELNGIPHDTCTVAGYNSLTYINDKHPYEIYAYTNGKKAVIDYFLTRGVYLDASHFR
jgi:hypothetical protein